MSRRITRIAAAAFATVALSLSGLSAQAVGDHLEFWDGCDHGATGKDCRPDPQPDRGKDCELHGNWGGVNEDHCLPPS